MGGPNKAHKYYQTQSGWKDYCSTPTCGPHQLQEPEPEPEPAVVENASLAVELASSSEDCSQFCCWSPKGDCGDCGTDWNNRMYPPGCQVPAPARTAALTRRTSTTRRRAAGRTTARPRRVVGER